MRNKKHWLRIYFLLASFLIITTGQHGIGKTGQNRDRGNFRSQKLKRFRHSRESLESRPKYAEDQLLVEFKSFASQQSIRSLFLSYQVNILKKLPLENLYQVEVPPEVGIESMMSLLQRDPMIESARPNRIARICKTPNDPFFQMQYALFNNGGELRIPGSPTGTERADIHATAAWEETVGSENIVVAVIDTGVDMLHPDLVNQIASNGRDFVNDDFDATDDEGHGTFVAGIIAAETDNSEGVAGVAWNCKILPVKTMDELGEGFYSWIIEGIIWAVDNGADIINMSIGGPDSDPSLESALRYAYEHGVVVVASAGNDDTMVYYPAAYDDYVLAVAASDYNDHHASWSNPGPQVDVAAPGEWITGCLPTWYFGPGSLPYGYASGTSYSAPHVAGLAALLKSLKEWLSPEEIMSIIRYSADDINAAEFPGRDDNIGYGRINLEKALVPIVIEN